VLQAIKVLPELLDTGDARLGTLAKRVALSESHLAHLFRAQVGIPLRPYVLWLRLRKAATEIKRGQSLTVAAQAAGFADSSHLSNTFRRTFGLTPSELVRHVEWIE
jgi:AraC-like DNA-binding protein